MIDRSVGESPGFCLPGLAMNQLKSHEAGEGIRVIPSPFVHSQTP